jgi:hypothetical protein
MEVPNTAEAISVGRFGEILFLLSIMEVGNEQTPTIKIN